MINAYFILLILTLVPCWAENWVNVGTELFSRANLSKVFWNKDDVALLQARKYFQNMLPTDSMALIQTDEDFIKKTLDYFKEAYIHIKKETTDPDTYKILTTALSDAVGGYLKLYMLPITKVFYYSGSLSYEHASKVINFYQEIMDYLNSDGTNWRGPDPRLLSYIIARSCRRPRQQNTIDCRRIKDPCDRFLYIERTKDGQTKVPLPEINWEDKTMFTPIYDETSFSLNSPRHMNSLSKYYDSAKCCVNSMGPDIEENFDKAFNKWMESQVVPHLPDNQMYVALYDILKLVNKTRDLCDTFINIYNKNEANLKPTTSKYISVVNYENILHKLMNCKKYLIVGLFILIEVVLCCVACASIRRKSNSTSKISTSNIDFEQGFYCSEGSSSKESNKIRCPALGPGRNIIIDSEPGQKCNITLQELYPDKAPRDICKPEVADKSCTQPNTAKAMRSHQPETQAKCAPHCFCDYCNNMAKVMRTQEPKTQPKCAPNCVCDSCDNTAKAMRSQKPKTQSKCAPNCVCDSCDKTTKAMQSQEPKTQSKCAPDCVCDVCDITRSLQSSAILTCVSSSLKRTKTRTNKRSQTETDTSLSKCFCKSYKLSTSTALMSQIHQGTSYTSSDIPETTVYSSANEQTKNEDSRCKYPLLCKSCSKSCKNNGPTTLTQGNNTKNDDPKEICYSQKPIQYSSVGNNVDTTCVKKMHDTNFILPPRDLSRTISIGEEIESIADNNKPETVTKTASVTTQMIHANCMKSYIEFQIEKPYQAEFGFVSAYPKRGASCKIYETDNISSYGKGPAIYVEKQSSPIHHFIKDIAVSNFIVAQVKDVCAGTSTIVNPFFEITMNPEDKSLPITFLKDTDEKSIIPLYLAESTFNKNLRPKKRLDKSLIPTKLREKVQPQDTPVLESIEKNAELPEDMIILDKPSIETIKQELEKSTLLNLEKNTTEKVQIPVLTEIPLVTLKYPKSRVKPPVEPIVAQIPLQNPPISEKKHSRYSVKRLNAHSLEYYRELQIPSIEKEQTSTSKTIEETNLHTPETVPIVPTSHKSRLRCPEIVTYSSEIPQTHFEFRSALPQPRKIIKPPEMISKSVKESGGTFETKSKSSDSSEKKDRSHKVSSITTVIPSRSSRKTTGPYERKWNAPNLSNVTELSSRTSNNSKQTSPSSVRKSTHATMVSNESEVSHSPSKTTPTTLTTKLSPCRERRLKPPEILPPYVKTMEISPNQPTKKSTKRRIKPPEIITNFDIEVNFMPKEKTSPDVFIQYEETQLQTTETKSYNRDYSTNSSHKSKKKSRQTEITSMTSEFPGKSSMISFQPDNVTSQQQRVEAEKMLPENITKPPGNQHEKPRGILKYSRRLKIEDPMASKELQKVPRGILKRAEEVITAPSPQLEPEYPLSRHSSRISRKSTHK